MLLAGLFGYMRLPVSALPEVDFPTIEVTTSLPGASPETVAVLRNPRTVPGMGSSGSGGATTIIVNVTGNTVRSDQDLDRISMEMARKVEEIMARRSSLLGLRNPSIS